MKPPISSAEREALIRDLLGKPVHVEVDRPIGHVHKGMVYPVNYGYIPGILAGDGEAQDAYILGVAEPLKVFDGIVIGAVCRRDDVEDKLVDVLKANCSYYKIKSRNITEKSTRIIVEIRTKDPRKVTGEVKKLEDITTLSLLTYEGDIVS